MAHRNLHLTGKSTQITTYYTSLNFSQKEKAQSDHLLTYLSSKDLLPLHGLKTEECGLIKFSFVDINQMLNKTPERDIRRNLLDYYGLKKIDDKVTLPQIVINEYTLKKKPMKGIRRLKMGSNSAAPSPREEYGLLQSQKGDFSEASQGKKLEEAKGTQAQQSSRGFKRKSSLQDEEGKKVAEAKRTWISDYKSALYLMDCKLLKKILLKENCAHYRLYKKVPIYSYTKGNGQDLATKMCSTCYLDKNPSSRYNLVIIGHFMRNNSRELHEICSVLESDAIYFHKIDKDNLNSQADVNFIKRAHKIESKSPQDEEIDFSIYLFGLKVESETITEALLSQGKLLQSLVSRHRCTFCFKQCSKKRQNSQRCKNKKDPLPACRSCIEKGLHKCNGLYYPPEVAKTMVKKAFRNKEYKESAMKARNGQSNVPWRVRDFTSQKKVPLSCRNLTSQRQIRLPHSTTEDLQSEHVDEVEIVKRKLHYEFPC